MFKLIALLFAIVNGVTAEKPSAAMKHNEAFATNEACEAYIGENGERDKKRIKEMAANADVSVEVKLLCIAEKTEDNTI